MLKQLCGWCTCLSGAVCVLALIRPRPPAPSPQVPMLKQLSSHQKALLVDALTLVREECVLRGSVSRCLCIRRWWRHLR